MSRRAATRGRRPAARAKAGAVKPRGVRSRPGRPSANHVNLRYDAFERQADAFATQVAAGERAVATCNLLRAAPGGFEVAGSPGRPLPTRLREELEPALGADLRAVRVHADERAALAVDGAGALALAAGADVFFGSGRYDAASPAGRDLLVHELAHVLQQTAVAGSAQPLRVRAAQGDGPARAAPAEPPPLARHPPRALPSAPRPDIEQLLSAHRSANLLYGPVESLAIEVEGRVSKDELEAYLAELEREMEKRLGVAPVLVDQRTLALEVDLLKHGRRFGVVQTIVERFPELGTAFHDAGARTAPDTWLAEDWRRLRLLRDYRRAAWLDTFRLFLSGSTRSIPQFGLKAIESFVDAELAKPGTWLKPNERAFAVLLAVERVDRIRRAYLEQALNDAGGGLPDRASPGQRLAVARRLVRDKGRLAATIGVEGESPDVHWLLEDLAASVESIATSAVGYWEAGARLWEVLRTGSSSPQLDEAKALIARVVARPEIGAFVRAVLPRMRDVFALRDGGDGLRNAPLAPLEYLRACEKAASTIASATYTAFEQPVIQPTTTKAIDPLLLPAFAVLQIVLSELTAALWAIDASAPDDALLAHRIRLGRRIENLGRAFSDAALRELGHQVVTASLAGQTQPQLALLSYWREDLGSVERLSADFSPQDVIRGLGVTPDELVSFYLALYYGQYTAAIAREMPRLEAGPTTVLPRAQAHVDRSELPHRWVVDDIDLAINKSQESRWGETILRHPKSSWLLDSAVPYIVPQEFEPRVFAWTLPGFSRLIERMQEYKPFSIVIAGHLHAIPASQLRDSDRVVRAVRELGAGDWIQAFVAAFADSTAQTRKTRAAFDRQLADERRTAGSRLNSAMREASIAQRHQRVAVLRKVLEEVPRASPVTAVHTALAAGTILRWEIPSQVLGTLLDVVAELGPERDRPLHEAAALLELAPEIDAALGERPRLDLVLDYKPRLEAAVARAVPEARPALRRLLPQHGSTDAQIDTWIGAREKTLTAAIQRLAKAETDTQRHLGFEAVGSGLAAFVVAIGHGERIGVKEPFTIDASAWQIVEILQPFTYHPAHGTQPSVLTIGGKDIAPADRKASGPLLRVTWGEAEIAVDGTREDVLKPLAHAITMAAMARQLQGLGEMIKAFNELLMTAAEFVPGAGQILMATRLVASILEFVASKEFETLLDTFLRDPQAAFERAAAVAEQVFTPAALWEGLLFGGEAFAPLGVSQDVPRKSPPAGAARTVGERLALLVRRMVAAGRVVLGSLMRTQTRVRWQMESVQLEVLRRPLLAHALRFVADNLDRVDAPTSAGIKTGDELKKSVESYAERVVAVAERISEFELPLELIPPGEIAGVVVELVLARLPGRYRIAGKMILLLLDLVGQRHVVFDAIGDAIPDELDPNRFWRTHVVDALAPRLTDARDALATEFLTQLAKFPGFPDKDEMDAQAKKATSKGRVKIADVDVAEVAETAPMPGPGGLAVAPGSPVALPGGPGAPLAPATRRGYEGRFGQDFGHVRVHAGSGAADAASSVGARALTSGSNIYLARGISAATGGGDRVLAHELTHVVQQTGSRPLGGPKSHAPSPGRPGRGLLLDPGQEAQADAVASRLRPAAGVAGAGGSGGIQPALPIALIRRILDRTAGTSDIASDAERAAEHTRPAKMPENVRRRVPTDDFMRQLDEAVQRGRSFTGALNETKVREAIGRHLKRDAGAHMTAVRGGLDDALLDAVVRKTPAPGAAPAGASAQIEWKLDRDRFADAVSRLLFGEAGVLVHVRLSSVDPQPVKVEAIDVVYVHLPQIHGLSELWSIATSTTDPVKGTRLLGDEERSKLLPRLSSHLENVGVSDEVWVKGQFRLTPKVIEDVRAIAALAGGKKLEARQLPSKADYLSKDHAHPVGLRLSTHAQLTNAKAVERDSHHITQFLLLDYFTNGSPGAKDKQPFPLVGAPATTNPYPGLKVVGSNLSEFRDGKVVMELHKLHDESSRGGPMPAISLARVTHRTGRLHISKQDGDDQAGDAPSDAVSKVFKDLLGADYTVAEKQSATFAQYRAGYTGGDAALAAHIGNAMTKTYHWMRDLMEPRLTGALVGAEATYYNKLAEQQVPASPDKLTALDMQVKAARAVDHSRGILAKKGWV